MTVTATQNPAASPNGSRMASGSYLDTGTAAAFKITTGFRPTFVQVVNQPDRITMEWYHGMTAAHGVKTVANGTRTAATSNGITVHDDGFTVGLDTDLNVQNKQLRWRAEQAG